MSAGSRIESRRIKILKDDALGTGACYAIRQSSEKCRVVGRPTMHVGGFANVLSAQLDGKNVALKVKRTVKGAGTSKTTLVYPCVACMAEGPLMHGKRGCEGYWY